MDEEMTKRHRESKLPTYNSWRELPHVPVSLGVMGSIGVTGEWRILRPEISREKCNRCGMCYLYCPEGTMIFKNGTDPEVNLTYCKGCGICASECPRKAIAMNPETAERSNHGRDE
jgi:2-oxoacid:acceptor oxidoreductase delta subunit (pyruvate/2-ketoisovalerate family)